MYLYIMDLYMDLYDTTVQLFLLKIATTQPSLRKGGPPKGKGKGPPLPPPAESGKGKGTGAARRERVPNSVESP